MKGPISPWSLPWDARDELAATIEDALAWREAVRVAGPAKLGISELGHARMLAHLDTSIDELRARAEGERLVELEVTTEIGHLEDYER